MANHQLKVKVEIPGGNAYNIWNFTTSSLTAEDMVAAWISKCRAAYVAMLSSAATLREVTDTELPSGPQYTESMSVAGGVAGDPAPSQVAAVITWRSALVGRAHRGRSYIPALSENSTSNGLIVAGQLTLMDTFAGTMLTDMASAGATLVVYHRLTSGGDTVISHVSRNIPHTIRRRTYQQGI